MATASTEAAELKMSLDTRAGGDNSVVRRNRKSTPDGYFALAPQVALRDKREELTYDLRYRPTYRAYMTIDGIDGVDHLASAATDWRVTPADTLGVDGRFRRQRRFRQLLVEDDTLPITDPDRFSVDENDRDIVQRAYASAYYSHVFTPRLNGRISYRFDDVDFRREDQVDTRAHTASLNASYVLGPKTTVGVVVTGRMRANRGLESANEFGGDTLTGDVGFSVRRAISPTLSASIQAGPSFIESKVRAPRGSLAFPTPPSFPTSNQRTESTRSFFAVATIDKSWRKSEFSAGYTRSESGGGGTASSSIVDRLNATFRHRISEFLTARLRGEWNRREELKGVQGQDQKVERYRVVASAEQALARRITLIAQFSYSHQERDNSSGARVKNDFYRGFLSLRYLFDPIRF
ncbi:MAG: hypothetical protein CL908_03795 [Deltaproteobacteria bacterium]|nr:hypothetical protein [Deltaproteobacteria bacterium]